MVDQTGRGPTHKLLQVTILLFLKALTIRRDVYVVMALTSSRSLLDCGVLFRVLLEIEMTLKDNKLVVNQIFGTTGSV